MTTLRTLVRRYWRVIRQAWQRVDPAEVEAPYPKEKQG